MADISISKSQKRAMALLNLPAVASYTEAAKALGAVIVEYDGIPFGQTWRTAAKLADASLLAAFTRKDDSYYDALANSQIDGY